MPLGKNTRSKTPKNRAAEKRLRTKAARRYATNMGKLMPKKPATKKLSPGAQKKQKAAARVPAKHTNHSKEGKMKEAVEEWNRINDQTGARP